MVEEWNNNTENTHKLEVNHFADWTSHERKRLTGYKHDPNKKKRYIMTANNGPIPNDIDWRTKGAVNPVQNQGMCGSCWAFSAVAAVESAYFIKHGSLVKCSEQQLVDCAGSFGNYGCNGGLMDNAFEYIEKNPLELESDYGYTAQDGSCKYVPSKGVCTVASYADVTPNSPTALKTALNSGPASVAIEADQYVFQAYSSGIITSAQCGTQLDHGVLAVGYGTENGVGYFIVRNSWGASWGEKGYVRIADSKDNICGILSAASRPWE